MPIRRGEPWGVAAPLPADAVRVDGDRALHEVIASESGSPIHLVGGDLFRAVGGGTSAPGRRVRLTIDVVRAETAAGDAARFVSHLVGRRSWWRGEIVAAMNGQYLGPWDVAPRAHPNDGLVDVVRVAAGMTARDRLRARSRLRTGTHLPHPDITVLRAAAIEVDFARPLDLELDGRPWVRADWARLTVEPDALTIYV